MTDLPPGGGRWAVRRFGPMSAFSIEECRRVRRYVAMACDAASGYDAAGFVDDPNAVFAAAYALVLAGEAASRIAQNFKSSTPDIAWGEIALTRHRLAHAVDPPDPALIAELVFTHAPGLLEQLDTLLEETP